MRGRAATLASPDEALRKDEREAEWEAEWRAMVYRPLDVELRQIRLLELLPNLDIRNDPQGILHTVSLGATTFAAVSYVWGKPDAQSDMVLNGLHVKIGTNAHTALRYLRKSTASRFVWIDALCINQFDEQEKARQIPLMKDIYTLAAPLLIWTGPGEKHSVKAFNLVLRMGIVMLEAPNSPAHRKKKQAVWSAMQDVPIEDWQYLAEFAQNDLWRRVWVVQEIILAAFEPAGIHGRGTQRAQAILVAGKHECAYSTFVWGVRAITSSWTMFDAENYGSTRSTTQTIIREVVMSASTAHLPYDSWMVQGNLSPESLLSYIHPLQATRDEDLVYGLCGLMPYLSPGIDYNKSLAEVYEEATYAMLVRSGSLLPMLSISHHWRTLRDDIPSWAIDWREKKDGNFAERWQELSPFYNACYGHNDLPVRHGDRLGVMAHLLFTFNDAHALGPTTEFDHVTLRAPLRYRLFALNALGIDSNSPLPAIHNFYVNFARLLLLDFFVEIEDGYHRRLMGYRPPLAGTTLHAAYGIICDQLSNVAPDDVVHMRAYRLLSQRLRNTRIAVSPSKQLCVVPAKAQVDDVVCILSGSGVPVVLRPVETEVGVMYQVVGGAYVHGMMDGEAVADSAKRVSTGDPDAYDTAFEQIWLV